MFFIIEKAKETILDFSQGIESFIESNDETNFPHKLLLTNTQVSKICKAFANILFANITFSKTQSSKMMHLRGFLDRLLGSLLKTGLSLIGNALKPLTISMLVPSGLMTATSAIDAVIQKKVFGSDMNFFGSTWVFSNEDN